MLKVQKVRLYPTATQISIIESHFGASRYVFNRSLALRKFAYQKFGMNVGKFQLQKHMTKLKQRENTKWLKNIDSQAIQAIIANLDIAYKNFFTRGGFPKFKSVHNSRQSYQYPQRVKIEGSKVYLPKVGWVKAKGLRTNFTGKIKTVTVSRESNQYHASLLIEVEAENINFHNSKSVGLDMGVSLFVADSNGKKIKPIDFSRDISTLKKRHQQLSNKKKGSNNRTKAKKRLSKQYLKIRNKRNDFLHKLSNKYSENQTVVIEDLRIKNMTKSARGTIEAPKKSAGKRGLNNAILQQGWSIFFEMLQYKLDSRGGQLVRINPAYTSQKCNECGYISKENRKSQSAFKCLKCGHTANADINAAKNILTAGLAAVNASQQIAD